MSGLNKFAPIKWCRTSYLWYHAFAVSFLYWELPPLADNCIESMLICQSNIIEMEKNNFIEFKFICKINFNVYLFKAGEIMKNKLKGIFCLLSIFVLSSCSFVNYSDKDMNNMNLIELNQYNKDLIEDNEDVKSDYENLVDISDGKTKEEIIELFNYVNDEVVKSNVMNTSESKSFFHTTSVSSGSGTIIKEDSSY